MKRTFSIIIIILVFINLSHQSIYAQTIYAENTEMDKLFGFEGYFIDGGYNAYINEAAFAYNGPLDCDAKLSSPCWNIYKRYENERTWSLRFHDNYRDPYTNSYTFKDSKVKVPDQINGKVIKEIVSSCEIKEFDLNPENQYMKCVDNVIFSKDGKLLMSYAQFDEREEYTVPDETETIGAGAFCESRNLKQVFFTRNSNIKSIEELTFQNDESESILYTLTLPSFDIKIDRAAFGSFFSFSPELQLNSYVQPKLSSEENSILWDKISNTSYYEIYQKLNSGEYKLLKTTKATACKFTTLKSGKKYTFAVKPVAVIPAANFDKEKDEGSYPETFTIEGTMSEDIVVIGK